MSFPTPLGPWFVVQRLRYDEKEINKIIGVEYYQHAEDGEGLWTLDKTHALLLMSVMAAARIAEPETAEVRCLSTKEEAKEFGRS